MSLSTTPSNVAAPQSPTPVARGLSTWPANPPAFDSVEITAGTLKVPLSLRPSTSPPSDIRIGRAVTAGESLSEARIPGQHRALAPTDGIVRGVTQAMLLDGTCVPAAEIEVAASVESPADAPGGSSQSRDANLDLATMLDRLAECGVTAARHDSPDLHDQLALALKRPVDTVICSVLDVEPAACVQAAWAANHAADLVAGVSALAKACGAARRFIVLNEEAPSKWFNTLRSEVRSADRSLRILTLENDYPQADPSLLMYTLLNRRLKPGRLPVEQGTVLLDAVAATALGACLTRNEPMLRIPLCVRDHDRAESYFLLVAQGVSAGQILATLGLTAADNGEAALLLRGGDVLRDCRITPSAVVSPSELLLHGSTPPRRFNPDPCIRCAWCFEACPTRIQPANLLEAAQREDLSLAHRAGLHSCIECGICSYVCPSRLPLLDGIRAMRRHERALSTPAEGH